MTAPTFDFSSLVNLFMQLLPLLIIVAILPMFIKLFSGLVGA